jgi:hypothetical protein
MPLAGQTIDRTTGNSYDAARSRREFDEFVRNEAALERKKLEQSVQPMTVVPTEASHAMRVHQWEMTEAWSASLASIQAVMDSPSWASLYWLIHIRDENEGPRIRQTEREGYAEFQKYCGELAGRTGFKLNPDGVERLSKMVVVQMRAGKIEVTQETIDAALDVMLRNHVFSEGEIDYNPAWKTAAAPAQQAGSEEDERRGKEAVGFLAETAAASTVRAWIASLAANYGFVPSKEDLAYSVKWFRENNRSWFDRTSYDAFRLHMVKVGRWSTELLTHDDIRARAIDRLLDMNDRDVRGIVFHGSKEALLDLLQRRGVSLI